MNPEVLFEILGMVKDAGEGAFVLAVIYLLIPYFKTTVIGTIIGSIAYYVYKGVSTSIEIEREKQVLRRREWNRKWEPDSKEYIKAKRAERENT